MLVRGLIISRRFVQVRIEPKHRCTHISNYQSSEHELSQHDEQGVHGVFGQVRCGWTGA